MSIKTTKLNIDLNVADPMERDLALWKQYQDLNIDEAVLFFYRWQKTSISLGQIQSKKEEIINEARLRNIPYFERPTGGKAVLHGGDICYTFIAKQNDKNYGGALKESFKKVSQKVYQILSQVLKTSEMKTYSETDDKTKRAIQDNCFASKVSNENYLELAGKKYKVIGAAQKMGETSFIQQGSIQFNKLDIDWDLFNKQETIGSILKREFDLALLLEQLKNSSAY